MFKGYGTAVERSAQRRCPSARAHTLREEAPAAATRFTDPGPNRL